MPVAQLVHHFETMDYSTHSKKPSNFSRRRLSLKAIFRGHYRGSSSSSATRTASTVVSIPSPTMSSSSFEFLPVQPVTASQRAEHDPDPFAYFMPMIEFPQRRIEKSEQPVKAQRTFSSTSLAVQSEYQADRAPGLDLFEPRPHNMIHGGSVTAEPFIMDGIFQVMRSVEWDME